MKMPEQKPGRSIQDYATPKDFIAKVEQRYGQITFDLAAHQGNKVCPRYFGPGSPLAEDAFEVNWAELPGLLWLNPPYADIGRWAYKAKNSAGAGARIAMLVPASVGANWFWDSVERYARVYCLSPRLSFDGKNPYPKDLILAVYDCFPNDIVRWRWNQ